MASEIRKSIWGTAASTVSAGLLWAANQIWPNLMPAYVPLLVLILGPPILIFALWQWKRAHDPTPAHAPTVDEVYERLRVEKEARERLGNEKAEGQLRSLAWLWEQFEKRNQSPAPTSQRPFGAAVLERAIETRPPHIDAILDAKRRSVAEALETARKRFDVPLRDVLKRIAFESEWAVTRDWSSPRDHWQETMWWVPLGKEMMRPLASDDIPSRGIRGTNKGEEHGHTNIPASFWLDPKLEPEAARLLLEPGYNFVMNFAEGYDYQDIRLRRVDVDREWPARSEADIAAKPSPFIAWAEEWKAAYDEQLINAQMEHEEMRARAEREADRIPFSGLRKIAIKAGLNLDHRDPGASNLAYEIEGALKEAAANNRLNVWGRPFNGPVQDNDPLVPIPAAHFLKYSFRHGALDHLESNNKRTRTITMALLVEGKEGLEGETFYDLHVSAMAARAVIERIARERTGK